MTFQNILQIFGHLTAITAAVGQVDPQAVPPAVTSAINKITPVLQVATGFHTPSNVNDIIAEITDALRVSGVAQALSAHGNASEHFENIMAIVANAEKNDADLVAGKPILVVSEPASFGGVEDRILVIACRASSAAAKVLTAS